MPQYNFPRGRDALDPEQAKRKGGSSSFTPFLPQIKWKDGEERFIVFLHPAEVAPRVLYHEFIQLPEGSDSRFGFYLSRKTEGIDEDYDDLEDRLGKTPKVRNILVAVELEPILDPKAKGRKAVKGFRVVTEKFNRRTDDGEEEVEAPVVGLVIQSPGNFGGYLGSFADREGPIEDTVFKVTRRGDDRDTKYDFIPYDGVEVEYDNLVDLIENVNYLREELEEGLADDLESLESDKERALLIGETLLDKRLQELGDKDRYDQEVGGIEELPPGRFDKKDSKDGTPKSRPARRSQGPADDDVDTDSTDGGSPDFSEVRRRAEARRAKRKAETVA